MSSTIITVPKGMSPINAFRALWESSRPAMFFLNAPSLYELQADTVSSAAKVAELFKDSKHFDYVGGRPIKMDFSTFPKLDVSLYDKEMKVVGAAQNAISEYNQIPSSDRFDSNDFYKWPIQP